jgi:3',5'-cyclic AMP phosphodiesterase CpdA
MGDVHDADSDLRNELERDLRTVRSTRIQRLDGIVISGDVAFGGQPEEFAFARGWIEKIRELLDCVKTGIMTIPGNHDVDRRPYV